MEQDFNKFMSQLRETNQTLDFFCDFDKISAKLDNIKLSLCMLNSLIGTTDLRRSVETIWNRDDHRNRQRSLQIYATHKTSSELPGSRRIEGKTDLCYCQGCPK